MNVSSVHFEEVPVTLTDLVVVKNKIDAFLTNECKHNDAGTRRRVVTGLSAIMREAQATRLVTKWRIICDETNNESDCSDDMIRVNVYVQPNRCLNSFEWNIRHIIVHTVDRDELMTLAGIDL